MNKKEISEIKKLFSAERCCIQRICGCYVNSEKEKLLYVESPFFNMPEEAGNKYFDIFRKALSGKMGKTAFCFEFPSYSGDAEANWLRVRDSELKDNAVINTLYDKIIENYICDNAYYIIMTHGIYDIPHVGRDNREMEDGSDYVYSFILCCICPVKLSKPGLQYKQEENVIINNSGNRMVTQPDIAFLYPAFIGRQPDIHHMYYYTKKATDVHDLFVEKVLQCNIPFTASDQKGRFNTMMEDTFSGQCSLNKMMDIHSQLAEYQEEHYREAASLDKMDVSNILLKCGGSAEQMKAYEKSFESLFGNQKVNADNIVSKRMAIESGDISIISDIGHLSDIEIEIINGSRYLLVPAYGEVSFNGIRIKGI